MDKEAWRQADKAVLSTGPEALWAALKHVQSETREDLRNEERLPRDWAARIDEALSDRAAWRGRGRA